MKTKIEQYVIDQEKKRRMDLKISQVALADSINVSKGFIGNVEVPKNDYKYNLNHLNEIAKVFSKEVVEIYNINNVHVIDEAEAEQSPSNVNHIRDIVIFAFVGIVIAVMYVLIANMLDTTIKTAEEVEKYIKIPVLASIPMYSSEDERKPMKKGGKR